MRKTLVIWGIAALVAIGLVFTACPGPEGPEGPRGPEGPDLEGGFPDLVPVCGEVS